MPKLRGKRRAAKAVWGGLVLILANLCASTVFAADLRQVRLGNHPDKTRVVLELDEAADYRIASQSANEILLRLDASAAPQAIAGNGKPLLWVRVEPRTGGTDIRLQLASRVGIKEMVLTGPDRIVLDLLPGLASPEPSVAETTPETMAEDPDDAWAELALDEVSEPIVETVEVEEKPLAEEQPSATFDADEQQALAEEEPTPASPNRPPPAPAAPPERSNQPLAVLGNPVVLGAVGLVVLLLAFWALRRRSAVEEEPKDAEEEAPPEDFATAMEAAPVAEPVAEPASEGSLFDVDEAEVAAEEDEFPAVKEAAVTSTPALDTRELGGDMAAIVQEIERRIAHLETRLEEVVDAKERLERQVAAQTEELRVQRAAIARTQRVLRGISRPEEEATDPVPK